MRHHILIVGDRRGEGGRCAAALGAHSSALNPFVRLVDVNKFDVSLLAQGQLDCVLLEYPAHGNAGMLVLQKLKMHVPDVPVIVIIAQADEFLEAHLAVSGAQLCLSAADVTPDHLIDCIDGLLDTPEKGSSAHSSGVQTSRILVVDDNEDDRENFIRMLGKIPDGEYGYDEADGLDEMLSCLDARMPDCILLDYSLPGLTGLDILNQLIPKYPFLPIIMTTGQGNEVVAAESIKSGAQSYLVKSSVTPDILHTSIQAAIRQRALERERSELVRRLLDSNTALERFAYVASHDLQEPIRMINSFGKILLTECQGTLDADSREYLHMITDSGERMRDVVNDLLEYSRIGNETGIQQCFDGNFALSSALDNLKALIDSSGAVITHDPLPELSGNPIQIMRLLQNLIANAIKYQAKGNIPQVHIGVQDMGAYCKIMVQDNGLGIDSRFQKEIFAPFRRLHTWEEIRGSGLGLAICSKIVEANGGAIEVISTLGQGSTFTVTLPRPVAMREAV